MTQNKFMDAKTCELNRTRFAEEQDKRAQRPRNGLFSMPVPLTVGDSSTNYQTIRKEKEQIGLNKNMIIRPNADSKSTFGKFISNCEGDPYQDPGKYLLRSKSIAAKPFVTSQAGRKITKSEFKYMDNGPPIRPTPEKKPRFATRTKYEPFSSFSKIGYTPDPYERKEDIKREEYALDNAKILNRNQAFINNVRQRGTFYPNYSTYGTKMSFPEKKQAPKKQPIFGPFKPGDPLKKGSKLGTFGHGRLSEQQYMEEMEEDRILQLMRSTQKNQPIWRGTSNAKSMMNKSVSCHFINQNKDRSLLF